MTCVYWLDQRLEDVPESGWLSRRERALMAQFRVPKRRSEWLLGRWTAKRAIVRVLQLDHAPGALTSIELLPGPDGAPVVVVRDRPTTLSVSLSHSGGIAVCAVAPPGAAVGCDVEAVARHSDAFVADYFTTDEREALGHSPVSEQIGLVSLLWSAKESVLKLLHSGLRLDTRSVSVRVSEALETGTVDAWHPFHALYVNGAMFRGWWQNTGAVVRTVTAFPPPSRPIHLALHKVDTKKQNNLPFGKISEEEAYLCHENHCGDQAGSTARFHRADRQHGTMDR